MSVWLTPNVLTTNRRTVTRAITRATRQASAVFPLTGCVAVHPQISSCSFSAPQLQPQLQPTVIKQTSAADAQALDE